MAYIEILTAGPVPGPFSRKIDFSQFLTESHKVEKSKNQIYFPNIRLYAKLGCMDFSRFGKFRNLLKFPYYMIFEMS